MRFGFGFPSFVVVRGLNLRISKNIAMNITEITPPKIFITEFSAEVGSIKLLGSVRPRVSVGIVVGPSGGRVKFTVSSVLERGRTVPVRFDGINLLSSN